MPDRTCLVFRSPEKQKQEGRIEPDRKESWILTEKKRQERDRKKS